MNQAAQQISSDPARDFANAILAETNGARDLIDLLHEISQGNYDASTNDQITANKILTDRGLGKCPKQSPVTDPTPNPAPETDDNDVEAIRESPPHHPPRRTRVPQARHPTRRLPEPVPGPSAKCRDPTNPSFPSSRESRVPRSFRPLFYPIFYPEIHSRNHRQRTDHPNRTHRHSLHRSRKPDRYTLPPQQGRHPPTRPYPRHKPRSCPQPRRSPA